MHAGLQITRVPVWLLKSTRNILKSFQWARDAADRLVMHPLLLLLSPLQASSQQADTVWLLCIELVEITDKITGKLQANHETSPGMCLVQHPLCTAASCVLGCGLYGTIFVVQVMRQSYACDWKPHSCLGRLLTMVCPACSAPLVLIALQAFADILSSSETFSAPMDETYKMLDIDPSSITTLESYLQDYYTSIMKKLKQVGASSRQTDFYV